MTCPDCLGTKVVKVRGCTCGGIDIGVGIMHEPGCGKEVCGRCAGTGEIDWPFGGSTMMVCGVEVWMPYVPLVVSSAYGDEKPYYFHDDKKYDKETLKEVRS